MTKQLALPIGVDLARGVDRTALHIAGDYQPYYVAFARAHGRTPDDQLAHDRAETPCGPMVAFIAWMGERWEEWARELGYSGRWPADAAKLDHGHAAFAAWLQEWPS